MGEANHLPVRESEDIPMSNSLTHASVSPANPEPWMNSPYAFPNTEARGSFGWAGGSDSIADGGASVFLSRALGCSTSASLDRLRILRIYRSRRRLKKRRYSRDRCL
jgi:hypothetical protein